MPTRITMAVIACLLWATVTQAQNENQDESLAVENSSDLNVTVLIRAQHAPSSAKWTTIRIAPGAVGAVHLASADSFVVRVQVTREENRVDEYKIEDFAIKTFIQLGEGAYDAAFRKWVIYERIDRGWRTKEYPNADSHDFDFYTRGDEGRLTIPDWVGREHARPAVRPK